MVSFSYLFSVLMGGSLFASTTAVKTSPQPQQQQQIEDALLLLKSLGVPEENLCTVLADNYNTQLRLCASQPQRYLEEEFPEEEETMFLLTHAFGAFACVTVAALAAGLTMGLLSLDPLMLMIKIRAGSSEEEKNQAASILPIVKQHHLLLVTLLLLNSIANEALPLFLEVLVSPLQAVILSVTLVLFGGEIIPSAIFTGPNKIALASKMTPLVKLVMLVLSPIAWPIAKVLDRLLHDDHNEAGALNRGELSALVRIQYEERMANKRQRKHELARFRKSFGVDDLAVDPNQPLTASLSTASDRRNFQAVFDSTAGFEDESLLSSEKSPSSQRISIHKDEVIMIEGALQMKTKCVMNVYTPLRDMYAIPHSTKLNEKTVVDIYCSGFSRVPVYEEIPDKPKKKSAIKGVLMTKKLMVINSNDDRSLDSLSLHIPLCVSPKVNLVNLLNLFQTGKSGHIALVCARPGIAEAHLLGGEALPEKAGLMGIITLEDILEELLQEEIADEFDKKEMRERDLSLWALRKWKTLVKKNKQQEVADKAVKKRKAEANETSGLLGGQKKKNFFFGLF
jgi:metal transporter CNNM